MKIGVIVSDTQMLAGGAYTFEEMLTQELSRISDKKHFEFCFYPKTLGKRRLVDEKPYRPRLATRVWDHVLSRFGLVSLHRWNEMIYSLKQSQLGSDESWDTNNELNQRLRQDGCELAYFVTPGIVPIEIPFIATHWDLAHRLFPIFPEVSVSGWKWGEREAQYTYQLPRACAVLTGTSTGRGELIEVYGLRDWQVIVNPFPVPQWVKNVAPTRPERLSSLLPFLYYPAQFWPHKNHVYLLTCLKELKVRGIGCRLVLSGTDKGNLEYIQAKATELGVRDEVDFLGFVTRGEMVWLYQNAILMAFPCLLGPDNLPPLEAMACGGRVAVAEIQGAHDYLPFEQVRFFDPFDERTLCTIVEEQLQPNKAVIGKVSSTLPSVEDYVGRLRTVLTSLASFRQTWGEYYRHT